MCKNCQSTPDAQARHTELKEAANTFQQHSTIENSQRLRAANNAVRNIHNDYVFDQARQHNEALRAKGIQPLYITHADKQQHTSVKPVSRNLNMNRIVAVAPWGDTYSAQDAEDGCVPSEASFVEEVEG